MREHTNSTISSGSSSCIKKKFRSASPVSSGKSPLLIRWAFVTIILSCAWRNISVSSMTGIRWESMSSLRTLPAPTDGSWSTSPMRMRVVLGGIACIKRFIRTRSTIDVSSTMTTSVSNGFWRLRLKALICGENSRSRWMVLASPPVVSLRRFAARPVGAVKVICLPWASNRRIIPTVVVVLPVPGPPVRIIARAVIAVWIAWHCCCAKWIPISCSNWVRTAVLIGDDTSGFPWLKFWSP